MARVPFIDPDEQSELSELADRISSGRRGKLINVYRTLLHSPPLAESWFQHINQVRWGTEIDGRLREIVIIRLGHLVASAYVLRQHVPVLAAGEGMSQAECDALADWQASDLFSVAEQAVLAYVDAMTRDIVVPDAAFEPLRTHYSNRQIVELTLMIGAYISHSRVLQALEVDLEPDENRV
jgi:alkylhydroperoxidase family enzyme